MTVGILAFAIVVMGGQMVILVKYFWKDSAVTRSHLTLGCLLMMMGNVVAFIGTYIGVKMGKLLPEEFLYAAIPGYLVPVGLWLYWRKVC